MIWASTLAMVVFDLAIVVAAVLGLRAYRRQRRDGLEERAMRGPALVCVGLMLTGAFYMVDLLTMLVLPLYLPRHTAMGVMEGLHLNARWLFSAATAVCLVIGVMLSGGTIIDASQQRRAIAGRLSAARDEERKAISRNLHDEVGQRLTSLKLEVARFKQALPLRAEHAFKELDSVLQSIDANIEAVQRLGLELRSPLLDDLGLLPAIEHLARDVGRSMDLHIVVRSNLSSYDCLEPELAEVVFRVAQEALTNVVRHAHAARALIDIEGDEEAVRLEVRDDGVGFSSTEKTSPASLGLLGMVERAEAAGGTIHIGEHADGGSVVRVVLPLGCCPTAPDPS